MSSLRNKLILLLFLALTAVGASLKIPLGMSSVALDSAPALLAGMLFGPFAGAMIGMVGHLLSAYIGGLPLGPFHLLIGAEMGAIIYLTAILWRERNLLLGLSFFIICTTVLAPLPFYYILSPSFYWTILFPLFIGSSFNSIIAGLIYKPIKNYWSRSNHHA